MGTLREQFKVVYLINGSKQSRQYFIRQLRIEKSDCGTSPAFALNFLLKRQEIIPRLLFIIGLVGKLFLLYKKFTGNVDSR